MKPAGERAARSRANAAVALSLTPTAFSQTRPAAQPSILSAAALTLAMQSINNRRQLMVAVTMYSNENRAFVPPDLRHLGKFLRAAAESATQATPPATGNPATHSAQL